MDDRAAMERALELAEHARGRVSPNPPVGCVVVRGGTIVGEGWTAPPGGLHAEAAAVRAAGDAARGATVYTTLEPCDHHGRTPPCTEALLAAGVARVVYAVADPNPLAGGGAARLRAAGVAVEADAAAAAPARTQLAAHLHATATGRPLVVLKLAVTLDGRVAAADGTSRWLTGPKARERAHWLRAEADAVVVGSGTALTDDPQLTVRLDGWDGPPPLRVVLDHRARLPTTAAVVDTTVAPTLLVTGPDADARRVAALRDAGVEIAVVDAPREGGGDLAATLAVLWDRGVRHVLVEGGSGVAGALLGAGLVDRLVVHHAPLLLGDAGVPAVAGLAVRTLGEAPGFALVDVERVDDDVLAVYEPADRPAGRQRRVADREAAPALEPAGSAPHSEGAR